MLYDFTYMGNLKETNEYNKTKTDSQIEQTSSYKWGERSGEGKDGWEIKRYKLLCIK